ncbi:MAG: sugar phosphate isomerase/epimerase [Clostridia bacterium]|nr:sugar phosphate isomerase/epimerase [Clostridia bacterium]
MLLTTQTMYTAKYFGIKESIKMLAAAGFDALDFSMFDMVDENCVLNGSNYTAYVNEMKLTAQQNNVVFAQGHAPFNLPYDRNGSDKDHIEFVTKRMIRSMEIASILEIPILVVHPLQFKKYWRGRNAKYFKKVNYDFYNSLMPLSEKLGVKIACENMWQYNSYKKKIVSSVCADPDEFNEYIDSVNNPNLVACLDVGHSKLVNREPQDVIRQMGSRIQALHIQDNNGMEDAHLIPGYGTLNWDEIMKALAEIDYKGNFTFEADYFLKPYKNDYEGAFLALKLMEHVGRKWMEKLNSLMQPEI